MPGLPDLANLLREELTGPSTLEEAIRSLDVYHGVPDPDSIQSTRLNASFLSEFRSYLSYLQDAESIVSAAIDNPEKVLNGTHPNTLVKKNLKERQKGRKVAPETSYQLQILDTETEFFSICYGHLQQITKRQWELSLARQEARVNENKEYSATKTPQGNFHFFAFSPPWELHAYEHSFNNKKFIHADLVPTEQPEYSQRWVSDKLHQLQSHLLPDVIAQEVQSEVATNFCFRDGSKLFEVSTVDHGDVEGLGNFLTTVGWSIVPEATRPKVYAHEFYYLPEAPLVPHLGIKNAGKMLEVLACLSPELRAQVRQDFFERFRHEAYIGIDSLLEQAKSQPPDEAFELGPSTLVRHVIYDLNPNLSDWDYRHELPGLSAMVTPIIIEKLWDHPKLDFVARTLANLMDNSRAENVLGSRQGKVSLGWHPEEVVFKLPVSLLHEDN